MRFDIEVKGGRILKTLPTWPDIHTFSPLASHVDASLFDPPGVALFEAMVNNSSPPCLDFWLHILHH